MASVSGSASGGNFEGIVRIEEEKIRSHQGEVVRQTVEQTLNGLLEAEADELCGAPIGRNGSTLEPATTTASCRHKAAK